MSEAALAQSGLQRAQPTIARAHRSRLSPLEALERGLALFRSTFAREAWRYYAGTAPLIVCFIPLWVVNGQIQVSNGTLFLEAMLLTGGYLFRVFMVSSYMRHVREQAFGTPTSKPEGRAARLAAMGRLLTWKAMLSAGALTTLPTLAGASWFYSACQFASLEAQEDGSERHSLTGCLALSSQWFGGGFLFLLMLFPLWIAVWLNALILAMVLPQLLHSLFGVNTLLSTETGMYALAQSSAFWLSLFAGTWVALDPIVKCTFAIVYQHLRSRREGDDLRGLLATLPRERQKKAQMISSKAAGGNAMIGAVFMLAAILTALALTGAARSAQAEPTGRTEIADNSARDARVQKLRQALTEESQRAIYRWHDAEHPTPPTWLDKLLAKMQHSIGRAWNSLVNFLRRFWPHSSTPSPPKASGAWQLKDLRLWLMLIAILTLVAGGVLVWLRRRKETASISIPIAIAPIPDLSDTAAASERSEDEWFALANRLEGEGELRLALRAAYFGLLAGLAQRQWLTIRRDRTNREYLNEFTRRWRRRPQASLDARTEIPEALRSSLRLFDGVWYGSHAVTGAAVTTYRQNQREFLNHV